MTGNPLEGTFTCDRDPEQCTGDQWFTSAGMAMLFAANNWREFSKFASGRVLKGRPLPIGRGDMMHHAGHVISLTDPERMPT